MCQDMLGYMCTYPDMSRNHSMSDIFPSPTLISSTQPYLPDKKLLCLTCNTDEFSSLYSEAYFLLFYSKWKRSILAQETLIFAMVLHCMCSTGCFRVITYVEIGILMNVYQKILLFYLFVQGM